MSYPYFNNPNLNSYYPYSLQPSVISLVPTISSVTPSLLTNTMFSPILPSVYSYQDINGDRNLRIQVTNYFFDKLLKNWLKYNFLDLYQLINVSNGL